ncbi:permease prefix domain 2-containing transporter [Bauldia sp.]|uniref:permease prefix domain 2-containing transporter n=1 Tax=Bauldia sp. TaxID=2575872 RepID=UPI003BA9DDD0
MKDPERLKIDYSVLARGRSRLFASRRAARQLELDILRDAISESERRLTEMMRTAEELSEWVERRREQRAVRPKALVPAFPETVLALVAPNEQVNAVVGDASERFHDNVAQFGETRARRLYWISTVKSVWPLIWSAAKRLGFVTLLIQTIRRVLG